MEEEVVFGNMIERRLFAYAHDHLSPIYGVMELTPLCNMNCDMCYVRLSPTEMKRQGRLRTLKEWLSIANEMKDAGVLFILLTGGEPLTYPFFKELYVELLKMGMILTINTNGTLFDEEWISFFKQHRPRRINITLYGDESDYDKLCHYKGGYSKVVHTLKRLREENIQTKINGSLTKTNLHSMDSILDLGEELDIPVRMDSYMCPALRERDKPFEFQSRLNPDDAAKARVHYLKREMGEEIFKESVKLQLKQLQEPYTGDNHLTCNAGNCSYVINWRGDMRPCIVMDEPSLPVFELGFQQAWKTLVEASSKITLCDHCMKCEYRNVCSVCATYVLLETGSYDGIPEYLCEYTKKTIEYYKKELEDEY